MRNSKCYTILIIFVVTWFVAGCGEQYITTDPDAEVDLAPSKAGPKGKGNPHAGGKANKKIKIEVIEAEDENEVEEEIEIDPNVGEAIKPGAVKVPLTEIGSELVPSPEFGWVILNSNAVGTLHVKVKVHGGVSPDGGAVYLHVASYPEGNIEIEQNDQQPIGEVKLNKKGKGHFHGEVSVADFAGEAILAKVVICGTLETEIVPLLIKPMAEDALM